jgi:hypothetical protein
LPRACFERQKGQSLGQEKGGWGERPREPLLKMGEYLLKTCPKNHQCKIYQTMNPEYIPAVLLDLSGGVSD